MSTVLGLSQVRAGYGAGDILKGITLEVARGTIVTIIGPNGSGKSTLLKAVVGLLPIRDGDVLLNAQSIRASSVTQRVRAGLAYVPQEYNVFGNMTVLENLQISHEFAARQGKPRDAGLVSDELRELFPELTGKLGVHAGNLSGGQRQMLAFACALSVRPELLILDEPSAGLSPKYMADIFRTVKKVNATGVSVLMVEQNAVEALAISDRCVVMANGTVRMDATAAQVAQSDLHDLYLGQVTEQAA